MCAVAFHLTETSDWCCQLGRGRRTRLLRHVRHALVGRVRRAGCEPTEPNESTVCISVDSVVVWTVLDT